jgi:hypothetical protein
MESTAAMRIRCDSWMATGNVAASPAAWLAIFSAAGAVDSFTSVLINERLK